MSLIGEPLDLFVMITGPIESPKGPLFVCDTWYDADSDECERSIVSPPDAQDIESCVLWLNGVQTIQLPRRRSR
jgi:hypothetical protein